MIREPRRCVVCDRREQPGENFYAHERRCIEADMARAMGPDYSRKGIFQTHNCAYCRDGELPCRQGAVHRCDNPRARND